MSNRRLRDSRTNIMTRQLLLTSARSTLRSAPVDFHRDLPFEDAPSLRRGHLRRYRARACFPQVISNPYQAYWKAFRATYRTWQTRGLSAAVHENGLNPDEPQVAMSTPINID